MRGGKVAQGLLARSRPAQEASKGTQCIMSVLTLERVWTSSRNFTRLFCREFTST